jgi:ABC-type nickel/cobalt efflux system permease component RcnA
MSRRSAVRLGAVAAAAVALVIGLPTAASAHPLGNFTVNRYSGVVVGTDTVTVQHVLDIAEIPTAQRSPRIDADGDGTLSRTELATWATTACDDARDSLQLTVAGSRAVLAVTSAAATTSPGQAGLPILRLDCRLRAPVTVTGRTTVELVDAAADDEVGWREMTARGDRTTLARSDVPTRSRSAVLRAYPKDLLSSPLDERAVHLTVTPGGPPLGASAYDGATPAETLTRGNDPLTLAFEGLLARTEGNAWLGIVAVLAALALGAAHAVAPGHGKTIMAFYLSGRREGALKAAATVGATVTATHTAGVLALGLLVSAGTAFVPARVYPWLSVASGVLVVLVGLALLRESARRTTRQHADGSHAHGLFGRPHTHGVERSHGHLHGHDHPHDHGPAVARVGADGVGVTVPRPVGDAVPVPHEPHEPHEHHAHSHSDSPAHSHEHTPSPGVPAHPHEASGAPVDAPPPSRRQLVAMGLAGGLLPSPSALLVLLGALALGHPWFGVALVVAFGLGRAATLAAVGLVVMRLRGRAEQRLAAHPASRFAPLLRLAPVLTAAVVVVLGLALTWRGVGSTGLV